VPVTVRIDSDQQFQSIEGWGGSLYPQTLRYFSDDPLYRKRLLEDLHVTHVRLRSVWYLLEAENDNDDANSIDFGALARGDTGLVHDELVLQQLLAESGVTLQFASWRFPYWMIGMPPEWKPAADEKPSLPLEMEDEYVESMAAYILYARERYGFVFDAVSVANEPDIGIYIRGLDPGRLLRISQKLEAVLSRFDYRTRFYLPDVAAADSIGMKYTREFFELDGANEFAAALAYHSYRREPDVVRFFGQEADRLGLPVWVTEQSHTHLAVDDRFDWSHAMENAVCLHDVLVNSNATLSLYWSLAMSSSGGLGLYIPEEQRWAPAYDMLKHFYNDVPVGSVRILAQSSDRRRVKTTAFRRPDGGGIAVMIINEGVEPVDLSLMLSGARARIQQAIVSQVHDVRNDRLPSLPIVLPPRSVSTLMLSETDELVD
jgi:O-glycosyl hydrolase